MTEPSIVTNACKQAAIHARFALGLESFIVSDMRKWNSHVSSQYMKVCQGGGVFERTKYSEEDYDRFNREVAECMRSCMYEHFPILQEASSSKKQ